MAADGDTSKLDHGRLNQEGRDVYRLGDSFVFPLRAMNDIHIEA